MARKKLSKPFGLAQKGPVSQHLGGNSTRIYGVPNDIKLQIHKFVIFVNSRASTAYETECEA